MENMLVTLPWIQIILSILLVTVILLQKSGSGLGGALGDNDGMVIHTTKRGFEKTLFIASIIIAILFVLSAVAAILL